MYYHFILVEILLSAATFFSSICGHNSESRFQQREEMIFYKDSLLQGIKRPCPCNETKYCSRVETHPKKEIFIFSVSNHNWLKYDWTKVTTVVEFGYHDDDLLCHAHSKGVRILSNVNIPVQDLTNQRARHIWVQQRVETVKNYFLDGINVDFESAIPAERKDLKQGYTDYITELKTTFKKHLPGAMVTVDVAWKSGGVDGRFYDYKRIADASDFLFVMSYDERSQIFHECLAWANSAYNNTLYGMRSYLKIGIPPAKLVLGVPWYGYRYPCMAYDTVTYHCWLKHVPFRGVNCSDAAGNEVDYGAIIKAYLPRSLTGRQWDKAAQSPFFILKDSRSDRVIQVWYDDPESLIIKYRLVSDLQLGGLGMWNADSLDYDDPKMTQSMWNAIPNLK